SHLDALDLRRVQGTRPLDADGARLLAHREGLARAGSLPADHDALEDLRPAALALDHLEVDADGVAGLEGRQIVTQLTLLECLDQAIHRQEGPKARRTM